MLIITLVIFFVVADTVYTEKNQRKVPCFKDYNLADLSSGSDSSDMDKALRSLRK